MGTITYTIPLTPENAEKIDKVNRILLENYSSEPDSPAKSSSEEKKPKSSKPAKEEKSSGISIDDFKKAARKVKRDHGEEFAMGVLGDNGYTEGATLGRVVSKVDEGNYGKIIKLWEAGPTADDSDDLDDDDDDFDDDDEDVVDADAVKAALRAYSKENGRDEAKEIMQKHGVKSLSGVDDLDNKKLVALMKELV